MKLKIALFLIIFILASTGFVQAQFKGTGRLTGKLLKSNGRPLPYTEIELVPVVLDDQLPDSRFWATSDVRGNFYFKDLPPLKYTLSINFNETPTELSPYPTFFYPNTHNRDGATVFEITNTSNIKNLVFRLPPALPQRIVKGKVVDESGNGVAGIHVSLQKADDEEFIFSGGSTTDKDGNFTLKGFETMSYVVNAVEIETPKDPFTPPKPPTAFGKSDSFVLNAQTPAIFVLLKKGKKKIFVDQNIGE